MMPKNQEKQESKDNFEEMDKREKYNKNRGCKGTNIAEINKTLKLWWTMITHCLKGDNTEKKSLDA